MLMPKKTKFRKVHRGRRRGETKGQSTVQFGESATRWPPLRHRIALAWCAPKLCPSSCTTVRRLGVPLIQVCQPGR